MTILWLPAMLLYAFAFLLWMSNHDAEGGLMIAAAMVLTLLAVESNDEEPE